MSVIDSIPLMTAIDVVIVLCSLVALKALFDLRSRFPQIRSGGLVMATAGLVLVAAVFFFDLVTMWAFPVWMGDSKAQEIMMDLHLNWSWGVLLAAALALASGIVMSARSASRTENQLVQMKGLYQDIARDQSELVVRWLPDGTQTFVNDAYCGYRRQSRRELVGASYLDYLTGEDRTRLEKTLSSLTPDRSRTTTCYSSHSPEGQPRWFEWANQGVFDESGTLVEVQSVGRDVTESRQLEDELRLRDNRYQAIFEATATGHTVRSLEDGRLLDVNPAMAEMFGYTRQEFLELEPEDYTSADARALYPKMLEAVRRGERFPFTVEGIHRDGRSLVLEGFFQPLEHSDSRLGLGVVRDVTTERRILQELQKSERAQRALFVHAPDAILLHGLDGKVLDANPAAGLLFGRPTEALVGLDLQELVPERLRQSALDMFARLAVGELEQFEGLCLTSEDTETPVSVRASRFAQGDETLVLVRLSDLSKRKKLEHQLRQAQKMEAVGRLAGGIAHDFNNLLTAILGYCELVKAEIGPSHPASEDLGEIEKAGESATNLTQQLLAFSRQQMLQPQVLDLNSIVLEIEKLCRRTLGEDIELVLKLGPELGLVKVDKSQIDQVLLNLVINARDAMPSGGKLTLETDNVVVSDGYNSGEAPVPPGSYVALRVTDNGTGMSKQVRSQVFEPFFSTKAPDKGTGLGLSTVYGIVKQSGGFVWVRSSLDVGSTFEVLLPLVQREAQDQWTKPEPRTVAAAGAVVLLVDDNPTVLRLANRTLEDHGYVVFSAETAEQASALASERGHMIDLLVTDLVLPGMNGLELARELRSSIPNLSIVLMTGFSRHRDLSQLEELRGTEFLQKPFVRRSLLSAAEAALLAASDGVEAPERLEVEL